MNNVNAPIGKEETLSEGLIRRFEDELKKMEDSSSTILHKVYQIQNFAEPIPTNTEPCKLDVEPKTMIDKLNSMITRMYNYNDTLIEAKKSLIKIV